LSILSLNTVAFELGVAAQGVTKADTHQGKRGDTVVGAGTAVLQGGMVSGDACLPILVQAFTVTNGLLGGCWWRIRGQGGVPGAGRCTKGGRQPVEETSTRAVRLPRTAHGRPRQRSGWRRARGQPGALRGRTLPKEEDKGTLVFSNGS
jgi:hypothetical protein